MIFAGVEAGKNTRGVTWIRIWQSSLASLIRGAEPGPEAGSATRAGGIQQERASQNIR
jgi:hypothetical protein